MRSAHPVSDTFGKTNMAASTQAKPWEALWTSISSYSGYVRSVEEFNAIKVAFEVHSSLSFVLGKKDAIFGTGADIRPGSKVWFSDKGGVVPNSGLPFVIISHLERDCIFGRDKHKAEKLKKQSVRDAQLQEDHPVPVPMRRKIQASKKKNCPAKILVLEVLTFPDFQISDTHTSSVAHQKKASRSIRLNLQSNRDTVKTERRFYISLPEPAKHCDVHPVSQLTGFLNPVAKEVREKIYELVAAGVTSVNELRRHLKDYVGSLFPTNPPAFTDLAYHPLDDTLKKHIYLCQQRLRDPVKRMSSSRRITSADVNLNQQKISTDAEACLPGNDEEVQYAVIQPIPSSDSEPQEPASSQQVPVHAVDDTAALGNTFVIRLLDRDNIAHTDHSDSSKLLMIQYGGSGDDKADNISTMKDTSLKNKADSVTVDTEIERTREQRKKIPSVNVASTEDRLVCGCCSYVGHHVKDFLFHKLSHSGQSKDLGCELCGRCYSNQRQLYNHYKQKHRVLLNLEHSKTKNATQREPVEENNKESACKDFNNDDAFHEEAIVENSTLKPSHASDIENECVKTVILHAAVDGRREFNECSMKEFIESKNTAAVSDIKKSPVCGSGETDFEFISNIGIVKGQSLCYGKHEFKCLHCQFKTQWRNTLCIHMKDKHADLIGHDKQYEVNLPPDKNGEKILRMSEYIDLQKKKMKVKKIRSIETQDLPGDFPCHLCGKVYHRLRYLRCHLKRHVQSSDLLCSECGKAFTTKAYLRQHLRTHLTKEMFRCSQCEFSSSSNTLIHAHIQDHSDGCLICDSCGTAFTDRATLQKHKRVHDKSRPFGCKFDGCTLRFKTEVMCNGHYKQHFTKGKFECSICGYVFRQKHHLLRHEKNQHNITSSKTKTPDVNNAQRSTRPEGNLEVPMEICTTPENKVVETNEVNLILNDGNTVDVRESSDDQFDLENALQSGQLVIATDEDGNPVNYEMSDINMNVAYQALLHGGEGQELDAQTILIPQADANNIVFEEATETVGTYVES